jgi:dTMP kinase
VKGIFITFEGVEGSGKSSQIKLLEQYLEENGYDHFVTREPGGPPISEAIRKLLLDVNNAEMVPETELLLYLASRAQHTVQWIIPALEQGKIVICDRYTDSSLAYQGGGRKLSASVINALTTFATRNLKPDITFLLDVDVEVGQKRIRNRTLDRLEEESLNFHKQVRQEYLKLAKQHKDRYIIIDGSLGVKEIHELIVKHMTTFIRSL